MHFRNGKEGKGGTDLFDQLNRSRQRNGPAFENFIFESAYFFLKYFLGYNQSYRALRILYMKGDTALT